MMNREVRFVFRW